MDFMELAKERYSCRKFSDKEVEQEKIEKILEAGILAPTAVNKQPFKIWVLKSEDAISKISQVTNYTFGAKLVFVIGADENEAWVRPFDNKNYAEIDTSIVATHMMLEVQNLGLGTTWIGYFDTAKLIELFPEMSKFSHCVLFPVGYPAEDAQPSPKHTQRKSKEELVTVL